MKLEEAYKIVLEEENNVYNSNGIKINVYGKEGENPHLHYYFKDVEGCIRLDIPKYFCHESYHEGLNALQRKFMIKWLNINWIKCVQIWNKDSNQEKINCEKPEYNLLPRLQPNGKLSKEDRK
jgi:hypothetical protein